MKIIVLANEQQQAEILSKDTDPGASIIFTDSFGSLFDHKTADAYFILSENVSAKEMNSITTGPVFVNAVITSLKEMEAPPNISRINAWPAFLQRDTWEVATQNEQEVKNIFDALNWKYLFTRDEPGLIAARIIAMIINEAFFTLDDNVSSKKEIDIAMKLGTNYPLGPFEWAEKTGLKNIYDLLMRLSVNDERYLVAPGMIKEINARHL